HRVPGCNELRAELGIGEASPVVGIVAALRPEKNHLLFLEAASMVREIISDARFVIVGDGPERKNIERRTRELRLEEHVHMLGTRSDIPALLSMFNVLALTSHNEANPVSILE